MYLLHGKEVTDMNTAKLFKSGNSQAVRLPKAYNFEGREVYVNKLGRTVILLPKDDPWEMLVSSLDRFTDDFMNEREQPVFQEREGL
jgi:antitoxin VapB